MRISIILVFLCWVAYDQRLFARRRSYFSSGPEISLYEAERKRERREILRNHVIPKWHRGGHSYRSRLNYFSTKPRDVRFSDQRKLRRMFSNI
jgi:hypothetical protein